MPKALHEEEEKKSITIDLVSIYIHSELDDNFFVSSFLFTVPPFLHETKKKLKFLIKNTTISSLKQH